MDIKYLKVQDKVKEGIIDNERISTHDMRADPLMSFNKHVTRMGLQDAFD